MGNCPSASTSQEHNAAQEPHAAQETEQNGTDDAAESIEGCMIKVIGAMR